MQVTPARLGTALWVTPDPNVDPWSLEVTVSCTIPTPHLEAIHAIVVRSFEQIVASTHFADSQRAMMNRSAPAPTQTTRYRLPAP